MFSTYGFFFCFIHEHVRSMVGSCGGRLLFNHVDIMTVSHGKSKRASERMGEKQAGTTDLCKSYGAR